MKDNNYFFLALRNCSNFTDEQVRAVALVRGITAAVCCFLLFAVLVAIFILAKVDYQKVCGTVVKRLAVGFTVASVLQQFTLALSLKRHFDPDLEEFCEADGFFNQYFGSVWQLFTVGISLVLFLIVAKETSSWNFFRVINAEGNAYTCCSKQINKLELAVFASIFGLPLIFNWIPFTTDSYGPSGTWCWIRSLENDCSQHTAGLWEQLWLSRVPIILVAVITLVLLVMALFLLGCAIKNAKLAKKIFQLGIADSLLSLALLLFLFMMYLPPQGIITSNHFNRNRFVVWIFIAISSPFIGTLTPLALLVVIHLPLSTIFCACCKQQRHTGPQQRDHNNEQATVHESSNWNQPSHTTWHPPHSSNPSTVELQNL